MASYTKTFQPTDSYNSSDRIYTNPPYDYFTPQRYDSALYVSRQSFWSTANNKWLSFRNTPRIVFDLSSIPRGKKVTSAKLYLYGKGSYSQSIEVGASVPFKIQSGWFSVNVRANAGDGYAAYSFYQVDTTERGYGEIYSSRSSYAPYLVVEYEDAPPLAPVDLFPNDASLDARTPLKVSWKYKSDDNEVQTKYELQYSTNNKLTWTSVTGTANQFHNFTANTFPTTAQVYWRVRTTDDNELISPWGETYFNTVVIPQEAPIVIAPTTGFLDGNNPIEFSWRFVGGADYDKQSKFELIYDHDGDSDYTTIAKNTMVEKWVAPPNTFKSGNVRWIVKTFNAFGEASPSSSDAEFSVISNPPLPQIQSVTNSSKPVVTWISTEQQAYELQVIQSGSVIFDSGIVPSLQKEQKLDQYLQDGDYTARLRVTNKYDLSSPWAEYDFSINTSANKPPKPQITIFNEEYGVTIKTMDRSSQSLVYRDGKEIGTMDGTTFTDYTGKNNELHKYFVRAINEQDNFNDSDVKLGKCSFRYNTLAEFSHPSDYLVLKYGLNAIPKKTGETRNIGEIQYFDGRTYPAIEYSEFRSLSRNLSFMLRNKAELDKLESLINKKKPLIYRNNDGNNIHGVVLSLPDEETMFGYVVNITITKIGDKHD